VFLAEVGHNLRDDLQGSGENEGDPEAADFAMSCLASPIGRSLRSGEDFSRLDEKDGAGVGQLHNAAIPLQQADSNVLLKLMDLGGESGL
jgi:hypothetical protein